MKFLSKNRSQKINTMTASKEELIKELKETEAKKVNAIKEGNYEWAANYRDKENSLREQIDDIKKKHSR